MDYYSLECPMSSPLYVLASTFSLPRDSFSHPPQWTLALFSLQDQSLVLKSAEGQKLVTLIKFNLEFFPSLFVLFNSFQEVVANSSSQRLSFMLSSSNLVDVGLHFDIYFQQIFTYIVRKHGLIKKSFYYFYETI